jgi:hypothetical protein
MRGKSLQDIKYEKLWVDEGTEDLWPINLYKIEMMLGEGYSKEEEEEEMCVVT